MFFQINGFFISNLQKADDDKLVKVDIVANHLTEDSDGETILQEAFDEETVKNFLNVGVINFWHDNKNPALTKEAQMAAIIGKPIAFRWDNGKPVVTAQLTKTHPVVQNMLPHLEAANPVYAASVDGSKMVMLVKDEYGQNKRIIPKIKWDGLAIAPSNKVINRAAGVNVRLLSKAQDLIAEFDDLSAFQNLSSTVLSQETELRKAMEAPSSVSDMYETPGGVITEQSLEKTPVNFTFSDDDVMKVIGAMLEIRSGALPPTKEAYFNRFADDSEFAGKSYRLFDKFFKIN